MGGRRDQRLEVPDVAVHPAVGHQPEEMQRRTTGALKRLGERGIAGKRAGVDVIVDPHQVLPHHPTRPIQLGT